MFEIDTVRSFAAAHQLRGYQGDCSILHGHTWKVKVVLQASELDEIGIAVDFRKLKKVMDEVLEEFDHTNIAELERFREINPTSENIAKTIYQLVSEKMNSKTVKVARVKVYESPETSATYYE
ncbi:MAG: 6-carboxytetrahydropterin synthase QueD [Victivallaceae bacterium]|nr:6-carboxytetrahydropterin synthase QueD [Victivallaceae bacterium]MDD4181659.1 6-carboxytetrahydropterin synthase QueD [Victivallaceae bacterium]